MNGRITVNNPDNLCSNTWRTAELLYSVVLGECLTLGVLLRKDFPALNNFTVLGPFSLVSHKSRRLGKSSNGVDVVFMYVL